VAGEQFERSVEGAVVVAAVAVVLVGVALSALPAAQRDTSEPADLIA
jgi:hypothetical protein